jgi:hypothetical protein
MPSPLEFEGKTELGEREQSPLEVVRRFPVYFKKMLTQRRAQSPLEVVRRDAQFTCFTSTNVQILTRLRRPSRRDITCAATNLGAQVLS